jgi:hypothetical protein
MVKSKGNTDLSLIYRTPKLDHVIQARHLGKFSSSLLLPMLISVKAVPFSCRPPGTFFQQPHVINAPQRLYSLFAMPASLKHLYRSNGSTIKTTILRGTPPPPPPKPQPERLPLAAVDISTHPSEELALDYRLDDSNLCDIEGEEESDMLDGGDQKRRRLHQVGLLTLFCCCCI